MGILHPLQRRLFSAQTTLHRPRTHGPGTEAMLRRNRGVPAKDVLRKHGEASCSRGRMWGRLKRAVTSLRLALASHPQSTPEIHALPGLGVLGFDIALMVKQTSSAVKSSSSYQVMPSRK